LAPCFTSTSSTLTVVVGGTVHVRSAAVTKTSFDVYVDPCASLLSTLASQIKIDMGVPASSTLTCSFTSVSLLSSGKRTYQWDVAATWTD